MRWHTDLRTEGAAEMKLVEVRGVREVIERDRLGVDDPHRSTA